MAFCTKCGAQIDDNAVFCPTCGASAGAAPAGEQTTYGAPAGGPAYGAPPQGNAQYQAPPQQGYQQQGYQPDFSNPQVDAQTNKVFGILAYLGILVLVTLLAAPKNSKFARFHGNQGLVLLIGEVGAYIVIAIILAILGAIASATYSWGLFTVVGILSTILYLVISICALVFLIIGIINAAGGNCKPLPLIGKIKILK
jgi:uncharacterized membrane protein